MKINSWASNFPTKKQQQPETTIRDRIYIKWWFINYDRKKRFPKFAIKGACNVTDNLTHKVES